MKLRIDKSSRLVNVEKGNTSPIARLRDWLSDGLIVELKKWCVEFISGYVCLQESFDTTEYPVLMVPKSIPVLMEPKSIPVLRGLMHMSSEMNSIVSDMQLPKC